MSNWRRWICKAQWHNLSCFVQLMTKNRSKGLLERPKTCMLATKAILRVLYCGNSVSLWTQMRIGHRDFAAKQATATRQDLSFASKISFPLKWCSFWASKPIRSKSLLIDATNSFWAERFQTIPSSLCVAQRTKGLTQALSRRQMSKSFSNNETPLRKKRSQSTVKHR